MTVSRLVAALSLAIAAALPATAQMNGYGGFDIVALAGQETYYGQARGWNVFVARTPAGPAYCFAEGVRSDGTAHRLGWDGMQWQLAVPVTSDPDWQGTLRIDGLGSGQGYGRGPDTISGTAVGGWTIAWLGMAELDGLQQGQQAILGAGRGDYDFMLTGSAAAILKVQECMSQPGPANAPAEPSETAQLHYETAGDWVINEIRADGQTLACEAYDTVQPTLRFEIDRDNSYIDFRDMGPMGGPGARVDVRITFGPGDPGLVQPVEIIEGRDGNAWGRIIEGRLDGPGLIDDYFRNATQVSFQGPDIILERGLYGSKAALDAFFRCSNNIR